MRTDGQTDRHDEANSSILKFCQTPKHYVTQILLIQVVAKLLIFEDRSEVYCDVPCFDTVHSGK
jgi:hypothetical protein